MDDLKNGFERCLKILKDNEGLVGNKALKQISLLLTLKLIPPNTKDIFMKGKSFDIKNPVNFEKLENILKSIDLSNINYDILGKLYEQVFTIKELKGLGQFFTLPLIKNIMVKMVKPKLHLDGKIETICDLAMGTAGLLITYLHNILEQAATQNIKPDWDFIKKDGIYGKELNPDTYDLAISNLLISSGHIFNNLDCGNSIYEPITKKFDIVLANPPFGVDIKYDDFDYPLKKEFLPIKTNNSISLFLQMIIKILNINGRCAIVLPDGKDLFSKTKMFVAVRKYLMKCCDLKEILILPAGIFTNTKIRTCIFYFVKKQEGTDVFESDSHQTSKVKFYDYNPYNDDKNLLIEVPIDKIANNSYSLNYTEYIENKQYKEGFIMKTLGDMCEILPKSKRTAKYGNAKGSHPFFKSSMVVDTYVDVPDYEEESLIIGDGGQASINYGIKFSTSNHCYCLRNKDKSTVNLKYCYYYLLNNINILQSEFKGLGLQHITKVSINNISIPVPSIERQQEVIKYCDEINDDIKGLNIDIENKKKRAEEYVNNV